MGNSLRKIKNQLNMNINALLFNIQLTSIYSILDDVTEGLKAGSSSSLEEHEVIITILDHLRKNYGIDEYNEGLERMKVYLK